MIDILTMIAAFLLFYAGHYFIVLDRVREHHPLLERVDDIVLDWSLSEV